MIWGTITETRPNTEIRRFDGTAHVAGLAPDPAEGGGAGLPGGAGQLWQNWSGTNPNPKTTKNDPKITRKLYSFLKNKTIAYLEFPFYEKYDFFVNFFQFLWIT